MKILSQYTDEQYKANILRFLAVANQCAPETVTEDHLFEAGKFFLDKMNGKNEGTSMMQGVWTALAKFPEQVIDRLAEHDDRLWDKITKSFGETNIRVTYNNFLMVPSDQQIGRQHRITKKILNEFS